MAPEQPAAPTAVPRVSICIPTYNRPEYLRLAIESVRAQTFVDWDLVVADNGSMEDSENVIASLGDPRIRYVRNERNLGLTGNLNRCLELARGEYVSILSDDDLLLPEHLSRKVPVLDAHPAVGFVHSNIYRIDAVGNVIGEHWIAHGGDYTESGMDCFLRLFDHNFVAFTSVLFRRRLALDVGGFDARLGFTVDWEFCLRLALHHDVAYLAQPLVCSRMHDDMESAKWTRRLREIRESRFLQALVLERFGGQIPDPARLEHEANWSAAKRALRLARRLCRRREFDEARECVAFAAEVFPPVKTYPRGLYVRARVASAPYIDGLLRALANR